MKSSERWIQVDGKSCRLTRTEWDLYQWLQNHAGKVVSRDSLLRNVWGFAEMADTRSVDMCVRRLRAKIGDTAIRTVYGEGYLMVA